MRLPGDDRSTPGRALVDRAWRGYDWRAMFPAVAAAAAVSAVVLSGRWFQHDLSELADRAGALAVFALGVAVWPGLLAVFLYRSVTYTYRLTDRAVMIDRGMLSPPEQPVWLSELAAATAGRGWLGRRLDVGWVDLTTSTGRTIRLTGVARPVEFARLIRETTAGVKPITPPSSPLPPLASPRTASGEAG